MLNKKKCIAGLVAVALLMGLAACNNGGAETTTKPSDDVVATTTVDGGSEGTTVADDPTSEEGDGLTNDERGMSRFEETVTLRYPLYVDPGQKFPEGDSYDNNVYSREYLEYLNIDTEIAWEAESVEDYNDKLARDILAGTLPDAFSCNMAIYSALSKANLIHDLTDVLDQWGTDFYKGNVMADGGDSYAQATVDGRLFGIPKGSTNVGGYQYLFVREDWRTALDLPEPKTLEDFRTLAEAFTTQDPDGNGVNDTYGIALSNEPNETWHASRGMFPMFGAYPSIWVEANGKVEYGSIQPEMKTGLAEIRSWYEAGWISPEFVSTSSWDIYTANNYGMTFGEAWLLGWPLQDVIRANNWQWKPYMVPYADGVDKRLAATDALQEVYVVNKNFEYPEALVKMNNLFMDRVMTGNYDTTIYKRDDDFNYESTAVFQPGNGIDRNRRNADIINQIIETGDESLLENKDQEDLWGRVSKFMNGVTWEEDAGAYTSGYCDYWGNVGAESMWGFRNKAEAENMYKFDMFKGSTTPAIDEYMKQLKSDEFATINSIISGEESLDYFDEFVASWWELGGDQITAEVNEWCEWYAASR